MNVNILLFPDFETLDAFGPVEVLGRISDYALHFVSMDGGLVTGRQKTPILTEPIDQADSKGILLIPGGQGTRPLVADQFGTEQASDVAHGIEYVWNNDKTNDPFSKKQI